MKGQDSARTNDSRSEFDFLGNMVFVKSVQMTKEGDPYSGLFLVIDERKDKGIAQVDRGTYKEWLSYRRLKPLKREGDTVVVTRPHSDN